MIEWSIVKIDAPVLVLTPAGVWARRHFAKYEEGLVYVWDIGHTSWTSGGMFNYTEGYAPERVRLVEKCMYM